MLLKSRGEELNIKYAGEIFMISGDIALIIILLAFLLFFVLLVSIVIVLIKIYKKQSNKEKDLKILELQKEIEELRNSKNQ